VVLRRLFETSAIVLLATTAVACGGGSSDSSPVVVPPPPPPPPPPDTTAPTVTFNPSTLTVASGATGTSTLTATDNVAVTVGPDVNCTNGTFSGSTFTAPTTTTDMTVTCTAMAEDAAGNSGSDTLTVTVTAPSAPPPAQSSVTISGTTTFDFVPPNGNNRGLNYNAIEQRPIRGATIEALSSTGTVLTSGVTDNTGAYNLTVDPNIPVRIRVKAELHQTTGAQWDVVAQDNTSSDALYTLQGSLTNSGGVDSQRDLNAGSGWGGSSYTGTRAAAPFAILDPIYESIQRIVAVDPDVIFPRAEFNWSINNRPGGNNIPNGDIGTSSYRGNGTILILGDANNDTDEYDDHVVVHEWGHYFEDQLSRSDSVGGPHGLGDRLDPRVAMGEGFGNALSGILSDSPIYFDTSLNQQANGFFFNVENNNNQNPGWYSEGSVQSILYDIFDSTDDGADTLSLGLGPVYETFISPTYTNSTLFTTIFAYLDELRTLQPASVAAIDALATEQNINGTGKDGVGETNNGSALPQIDTSSSLPVYKSVIVNGPAIEICSVDDAGDFNKLANRAFIRFDVTTAGSHTMTMTRVSGDTARDPDFNVFRADSFVGQADAGPAESDSDTRNLQVSEHIVDAFDFFNVQRNGTNGGDSCYDFTVTRP